MVELSYFDKYYEDESDSEYKAQRNKIKSLIIKENFLPTST